MTIKNKLGLMVLTVLLIGVVGHVIGSSTIVLAQKTKGVAGYLKSGAYVDKDGNPVDSTWCSTGWVKVSGSNPARYFCRGTHWGSGSLALRGSSTGKSRSLGGFLVTGAFLDDEGKPVEKTYCSTGWTKVAGSNPARYTCAGVVSGSGSLNYPD